VLDVSGHRSGTAEVEGAIGQANDVAEAAVVGFPHEIKGEAIYAYVTLMTGKSESDEITNDIKNSARKSSARTRLRKKFSSPRPFRKPVQEKSCGES